MNLTEILILSLKADDKEELMEYLKYCREVIFSGHNMSREEETLSEYFWKLYEKSLKQV